MHLPFLLRAGFAVVACAAIARRGMTNKSLDFSGGIAAVFVGFFLTLSNLCHFAVCITMFLTCSRITKFKSEVKRDLEDNFKEGKRPEPDLDLNNLADRYKVVHLL